jgi:hypothetical protein
VGFSVDANDDKYAERSSDGRHIYTEWITHIERRKFTACDVEFDSECVFAAMSSTMLSVGVVARDKANILQCSHVSIANLGVRFG